MGIILDTNVIINAQNKRDNIFDLTAKLLPYKDAFIAAITVSELLAGVHCAKTKDIGIARSVFAENVIRVVPILDFDSDVARVYAKLYSEALSSGRSNMNVHDLQIAATALAHNFAVATSNRGDFKHILDLTVEAV
jgi:predicted nucleic acid-binding protein